MNGAPYDLQNQADYLAMSGKIEAALIILENDSSIPATETKLAELATCSRGTLRNRVYPLVRLKEVKQRRLLKQDKLISSRITPAQRIAVDIHIEEKKKLQEQLNMSRAEIAVWVNKHIVLEREAKRLHRMNNVLQKSKEILAKQVEQLKGNVDL